MALSLKNTMVNLEFNGLNAGTSIYYDFSENPYFKIINTLLLENNSGSDLIVIVNQTLKFIVPSNTSLKIEKKDNIRIKSLIFENIGVSNILENELNAMVGYYE